MSKFFEVKFLVVLNSCPLNVNVGLNATHSACESDTRRTQKETLARKLNLVV